MLMPFFLTHAERPFSFSRPMSLCMVTITCIYMYMYNLEYTGGYVLLIQCMYFEVQSCTFLYMYRHMYEYGLGGGGGGGGGGSIEVGSCRTNQNGAATGLETMFILQAGFR